MKGALDKMNEEEKKAIEELEEFIKGSCETCKYCEAAYKLNRKNIRQLLNLTQKLQKENEELENDNKYLRERESYLEKRREDIINLFQNQQTNTTIPIQKIKNTIETLKKTNVNGEIFTTAVNFAILILQELIEEREEK